MNSEMHAIDDELESIKSLYSERRVSGLTHNFYRYPARFSPEFARETILRFSNEGDYVLDAFMGSGTTIVEAIANGRNAIGVDINPLSYFITKVKTTPLSNRDKEKILQWVDKINVVQSFEGHSHDIDGLKHIPQEYKNILVDLAKTIDTFEFPRQKNFAKCALLRLAQWAIDCRKELPQINVIKGQLIKQVNAMLDGIDELVFTTQGRGIPKHHITGRRQLYLGSLDYLINNRVFSRMQSKVRLVLTSPPYPGVHVLYHRWQVNSRRETPAPFWLAGIQDGHGEAYYTLGGRSSAGIRNYFTRLREIFNSVRMFVHPDAVVAQLVAFSHPDTQLPAFLNSMKLAGYEEFKPFITLDSERPNRLVPNRKWYTNIEGNQHASNEVLLFHRPYH
jgi:DNA modification methylase